MAIAKTGSPQVKMALNNPHLRTLLFFICLQGIV
jgi:hypothetical protein